MKSLKNGSLSEILRTVEFLGGEFKALPFQIAHGRGHIGKLGFPLEHRDPLFKDVYLVSGRTSELRTFIEAPAKLLDTTVCFIDGIGSDALYQKNINFVDKAGNALIRFPGVYINIKGQQLTTNKTSSDGVEGSLYPKSFLRVIFVLLAYPQLLKSRVVDIAESAGVSVGTVSGAFSRLDKEGYLIVEGRYRRLRYEKELADLWIEHYRTTLLPSLRERVVLGPSPKDWRAIFEYYPHDFSLSGENALAALGYGIAPETSTVYGSYPWKEVMVDFNLRPRSEGTTILREKFWKSPATSEKSNIVPALLIYADCLSVRDARQIEIAQKFRENSGEF